MTEEKHTSRFETRGMLKAVLFAGLLVGVLIAAGTALNFVLSGGKNPARLLNFVASGLYGKKAFESDEHNILHMAHLGFVFHFIISILWSLLYFALSSRLAFLTKKWSLSGVGYGILIWAIMVFVVMPLSNTPPVPVKFPAALIDIMIILAGAGLPISFLAHRHYSKSRIRPETD